MIKANFTPQELENELIVAVADCSDKGLAYVVKKASYEEIEDAKKIKFALLMDESKAESIAAKEKDVLKSEAWRLYVRRIVNARTAYLYSQMEYDNAIRNYETCRSLLSSKNTERRTCI